VLRPGHLLQCERPLSRCYKDFGRLTDGDLEKIDLVLLDIKSSIKRDIEVNDLRLGLNGAQPRSVSRFVDLGSNSHVDVALARFDAWLLPFINVYGLFGYVHNDSTTRGTVTVPALGLPGSRTFDFSGKTTIKSFHVILIFQDTWNESDPVSV
jgi:hypothetical protein